MKKNMALLFGGQSPEHEVSITSFKGVFPALPSDWKIYPVYIAKHGAWYLQPSGEKVLQGKIAQDQLCALASAENRKTILALLPNGKTPIDIHFVFVMLHGPNGEDGKLQGYLDMLGVPYSGAGAEASTICMNKDLTKQLCVKSDISVVSWVSCEKSQRQSLNAKEIPFPLPWIVKAARCGSSIGVSKVSDVSQLDRALDEAFKYDSLVLIEEFIKAREIECGVLEDVELGKFIASQISEIIPSGEIYTYNDKYINATAQLICPAKLKPDQVKKIQSLSVAAFKAVGGRGFARCDFFLKDDKEIFLSEINTIPGFTPFSMYPKMFEASGVNRQSLISKIIAAGLQK